MKIYPLGCQGQDDNTDLAYIVHVTDTLISISCFCRDHISTEIDNSNFPGGDPGIEGFKDWVFDRTERSRNPKYNIDLIGYRVHLADVDSRFTDTQNIYVFNGKSLLSYYDLHHWSDHALYVSATYLPDFTPRNFTPKYEETFNTKESLREYIANGFRMYMAYAYIPCRTNGFMDSHNTLLVNTTTNTIFQIDSEQAELMPQVEDSRYHEFVARQKWLPGCTIDGPVTIASNDNAVYSCQLRNYTYDNGNWILNGALIDYDFEVHIESSAGYLPVKKALVHNGQFTFDFYADRVPQGTQVELKINSSNYTDLGSIIVTVV